MKFDKPALLLEFCIDGRNSHSKKRNTYVNFLMFFSVSLCKSNFLKNLEIRSIDPNEITEEKIPNFARLATSLDEFFEFLRV